MNPTPVYFGKENFFPLPGECPTALEQTTWNAEIHEQVDVGIKGIQTCTGAKLQKQQRKPVLSSLCCPCNTILVFHAEFAHQHRQSFYLRNSEHLKKALDISRKNSPWYSGETPVCYMNPGSHQGLWVPSVPGSPLRPPSLHATWPWSGIHLSLC